MAERLTDEDWAAVESWVSQLSDSSSHYLVRAIAEIRAAWAERDEQQRKRAQIEEAFDALGTDVWRLIRERDEWHTRSDAWRTRAQQLRDALERALHWWMFGGEDLRSIQQSEYEECQRVLEGGDPDVSDTGG